MEPTTKNVKAKQSSESSSSRPTPDQVEEVLRSMEVNQAEVRRLREKRQQDLEETAKSPIKRFFARIAF